MSRGRTSPNCFICLLIFLVCSAVPPVFASSLIDLSELGVGARVIGMGNAFNSIATDGRALFTNPAGLAGAKKLEVLSLSGNLIGETPSMVLDGTWQTDGGVWGVGCAGASASGIQKSLLLNGTAESPGANANFGALTLVVGYANDAKEVAYLKDWRFLTERNARIGTNLKMISRGFNSAASQEGNGACSFNLDLGTQFPLNDNLTSSLVLKNLIPGNDPVQAELPPSLSGGFAYNLPERKLLTALDAEVSDGSFLLHLGAEWNPLTPLIMRSGLDQTRSGFNLALGLGLRFNGLNFDYAYHNYTGPSSSATNYFSLGFSGD